MLVVGSEVFVEHSKFFSDFLFFQFRVILLEVESHVERKQSYQNCYENRENSHEAVGKVREVLLEKLPIAERSQNVVSS